MACRLACHPSAHSPAVDGSAACSDERLTGARRHTGPAAHALVPALQPGVDRNHTRAGDREPQKQRQVLEFVEAEQRFQRVDVGPLGGAYRHDHGDAERAGRNACHEAEQQEQPAEELDPRYERSEQPWVGNTPADEILGDLRKVMELAPATPQENPADGETRKQWREPAEMPGDPPWPVDEPSHEKSHGRSCCVLRRGTVGREDRAVERYIASNAAARAYNRRLRTPADHAQFPA